MAALLGRRRWVRVDEDEDMPPRPMCLDFLVEADGGGPTAVVLDHASSMFANWIIVDGVTAWTRSNVVGD